MMHIDCPNGHEMEVPREMLNQDALCPKCDVQFRLREKDCRMVVMSQEVKIAAICLAFFLGIFGAHNYYLGENKLGTIKFVLTITVIGVYVSIPWVVVDIVRLIRVGRTSNWLR